MTQPLNTAFLTQSVNSILVVHIYITTLYTILIIRVMSLPGPDLTLNLVRFRLGKFWPHPVWSGYC